MPNTVISIENVSKSYQLGTIGTGTFYGDLNRWWAKLRGLPDPHLKIGEADHGNRDGETLWALKDINFQVQQGEVLGIIGRNGAGKSTLLKILSRVTAPTSGELKIKGRIASLLEVGTGFHPELTGRENIYLNGAIMGMDRPEIQHKFDEIVDFSGVEQFIDTPVKRYSSGMYVRLAFAVAAHLDPEILIIDEVLAVGDAEFQKKCLGKMGDVAHEGRTVLFVSHNMAAVSRLCAKGIVLRDGQVAFSGTAVGAIERYSSEQTSNQIRMMEWNAPNRPYPLTEIFRVRRYCVVDEAGIVVRGSLFNSRNYSLMVELEVLQPNRDIRIAFAVYAPDETLLLTSSANDSGQIDLGQIQPGIFRCAAPVPVSLLSAGTYSIELLCLVERSGWILPPGNESRIKFVLLRDFESNPFHANRLGGVNSPLAPVLEWTLHP